MDRPDTIIELHRERVQAQAAAVFAGDTFQRPYDGSFSEKGTATLTLRLDRVWFVLDAHSRLWQEEMGGQARDPLRHFAMDLVLEDSRILIESIAGIPLPPLPPATITIPDGPRAGEQRQFVFNELPLFGRLTLHEQLETRATEPGKQTVSLVFNAQSAPVLVAAPPPDQFVSQLFGPDIARRADGSTAFPGQDPRVTWDVDYAEAFWITHSLLGEVLVAREAILHPFESDAEHRRAVLDAVAAQIGVAVREVAADFGSGGIVDLLPNPLEVDPASTEGTRALDGIVQRFDAAGTTHESMVIQLQTLELLPPGEELPASVLAEQPAEQVALATAGFAVLRGVRSTVSRSFCLSDGDFDPDAGCRLIGVRSVNIGGENRSLDRFEAHIEEGTDTERGRLVVEGKVSDSKTLYEFDASFAITYEMDLDDIPREAAPGEIGTSTGETKRQLDDGLRAAAIAKCEGNLSVTDYEKEAKRVSELMKELPRTVGVRPTLNPREPVVDPDFSLTAAGIALAALGLAALLAAVAAPAAIGAGAALISGEAVIAFLIAAIVAYVALLIDVDWYGTGMVRGKIQDALGDRPGGTLLPTLGVPIDVQLRHHLAVYFRPLPPRLDVGCVKKDTREDADQVIQLVGGAWPTDGKPWKISDNDGVLMLDSEQLELFVASTGQPIHVSISSLGRRFLRANPDAQGVDNLAALPECPRTP
jgi:hypothetical protein